MKKTVDDFEKELKKCLELVKTKNTDYSDKHFLYNFDDFGYKGIIVRIGDKFSRLRTFYSKEKFEVKDESVEDTLRDIANYAIFCLLKFQEEKEDATTQVKKLYNKELMVQQDEQSVGYKNNSRV